MAHAPQASLYVVGFDPVVTHGAFELLSAVLMLGNIQFTTTETGKAGDLSELKVTNGKETLPWLAKCFQLEEAAIVRALTWRTTTTRGEPATVGADSADWYRAHPGRQVLVRQLATTRFAPHHAAWDSMEIAIEDQVGLSLLGRTSAEQAVADADTRLSELAARKGR